VFEVARDAEAGVRDDDVELAAFALDLLHRGLDVAIARDVAANDPDAGVRGREGSGDVVQLLDPPRREHEVRAFGREAPRERGADAGRSAGNEDGAITKAFARHARAPARTVGLARRAPR